MGTGLLASGALAPADLLRWNIRVVANDQDFPARIGHVEVTLSQNASSRDGFYNGMVVPDYELFTYGGRSSCQSMLRLEHYDGRTRTAWITTERGQPLYAGGWMPAVGGAVERIEHA